MKTIAATREDDGAVGSDRNPLKNDIIWGVKAIADEIDRTERQASHLLETGKLPGKKIGGRWISTRTALRGHLDPLSAKRA
jgi:hypothetical protein